MSGLIFDDISVSLERRTILEDVSFTVQPGEVVGLIGANGAGKSTVIRSALGLVAVDGGNIHVGGMDVSELTARELARKLAYVPQGAPVHWPLTSERLVGLGRTPHLNPWQELGEEDSAIIEHVMRQTDCWHLKERLVTSLSGGERARVMLARTMAVGAPYLLADEPTVSLDPLHQLQVMDIMKAEAKRGTGVLIVLHDLSFALRYCDKLVLLHDHKVLGSGSPTDVLTDANLEKAFQVKVSRWAENGDHFLVPHIS